MVFEHQFRSRNRLETLISASIMRVVRMGWVGGILLVNVWNLAFAGDSGVSVAREPVSGVEYLKEASQLYEKGQYFKAARYAFAAYEKDSALKPGAYAWVTLSLAHAGLPQSASYFFIRTLQSGDPTSIRSVLTQTHNLIFRVGADLLRKYLIQHTHYEDYDAFNRGSYLYALGKDALVSGDPKRALGYLNGIQSSNPIWPFALQIRGTALALLNQGDEAIGDFKDCADRADSIIGQEGQTAQSIRRSQREADDLRSRCIAGHARTLYQLERFEEADRVYDQIPKRSFVWPDILFEQAWNSFARGEYNRTLGKLVSYKSPSLSFMFNTEIEVLRAQAFLALCLYGDANQATNEFNTKYTHVGIEVKEFVERNSNQLGAFYDLGKTSLNSSIYIQGGFHQMLNRFVRGPYFQNLTESERQVKVEQEVIRRFDSTQPGVKHDMAEGFPGFLEQVLHWRVKSIRLLGGAFIKNSLLDYHAAMIDDFEKMAFIKLEMLKKSKDQLMSRQQETQGAIKERTRGNQEPEPRNDQYRWSFNGEFWTDELGDYVFGLDSECKS